jgi:phage shock protein B
MSLAVFFFVPVIVFLAFVAPLWLIFHYITKWKTMKQQPMGDGMIGISKEEMQKLRATARKLNDRLVALEKILDQD